jgi:hypothetical protein
VRFDAAGDLLGTTTLPYYRAQAPVVASDGDGFLVVFALPTPEWTMVAVRVSRDGVAGDLIPLGVWNLSSQWASAAAIDGTYFVTFGTSTGRTLIRLSEAGIERAVDLPATPMFISQARIESSGDRLLVVATGGVPGSVPFDDWMRVAIFDRDLATLKPWTPVDGGTVLPRIAPTSSGWVITAESYDGTATLLPLSLSGVPGSPATASAVGMFTHDAAGRGDRAAVVWTTPRDSTTPDFEHTDATIAVVDSSGALVRAPAPISLGPAPQIHHAAAHGGGVTLVAWVERNPAGEFVVKARPFDGMGTPVAPPITMPWHGADQLRPAVASNGDSFFVVWSEGPSGSSGVYGATVGTDGTLLGDDAIPLFDSARLPKESAYRTAHVAWSGSAWIVTSSDSIWKLVARRVSPGGAILDPEPRVISPVPEWNEDVSFAPLIDCNGRECLIAWYAPPEGLIPGCQFTCPEPPVAIRAAVVSPDLNVVVSRQVTLTSAWSSFPPGTRALEVTWNEEAAAWLLSWDMNGSQRIRRDGFLLSRPTFRLWSNGTLSSLPEREGWRMIWTPSGTRDVFHGWTLTGLIADIRERSAVAASADAEWDPQAIESPRPLVMFLRETPHAPGSPEVVGRFLDESAPADRMELSLTATRAGGEVRLDWATNAEEISAFTILLFRQNYYGGDGWYIGGSAAPTARHFSLEPGMMKYATRAVVTAATPSGAIRSNEVEIESARRRTVAR